MIFDFLMAAPYAERVVDRYEDGDLLVSTAAVTDSRHPFETAVSHPQYNDDKWVIVATYRDRDSAVGGHKKWVAAMTSDPLPDFIRDVSSAEIADLCDDLGSDDWRIHRRCDQ